MGLGKFLGLDKLCPIELINGYLWVQLNNDIIYDSIIKELNIYDYEP